MHIDCLLNAAAEATLNVALPCFVSFLVPSVDLLIALFVLALLNSTAFSFAFHLRSFLRSRSDIQAVSDQTANGAAGMFNKQLTAVGVPTVDDLIGQYECGPCLLVGRLDVFAAFAAQR